MTSRAIVTVCSSDSTAHGPAMITSRVPPTGTPPIETTVSLGVELAGDELVGVRDLDDLEDPGKVLERGRLDGPPVSGDPDGGPLLTRYRVGLQPHPPGGFDHPVDVGRGGAPVHDDQHGVSSSGTAVYTSSWRAGTSRRAEEAPMAIRRTLSLSGLALAGALLAALPAPAYLIILKDGTRIEAAEKPVEQGRNFVFKDKLGRPEDDRDHRGGPGEDGCGEPGELPGRLHPRRSGADEEGKGGGRQGPVAVGVHQAEQEVRHPGPCRRYAREP